MIYIYIYKLKKLNLVEQRIEASLVVGSSPILGIKIDVLELVDKFLLGRNGLVAVQVQVLSSIYLSRGLMGKS
jgi:hypothetical protein